MHIEKLTFNCSFSELSNETQMDIMNKVKMRIGASLTEEELTQFEGEVEKNFSDWFVKEIQPQIEKTRFEVEVEVDKYGSKNK